MDALTTLMPLSYLVFAALVTLVSGVVKGAVGFAMPLIMISGMGIFMEPTLAVAGIILPIVMSNALQVLRAGLGDAWAAIRDFWVYIVIVCAMILISAQFLTVIPTRTMFLVLGIPVVVLCGIQLAGLRIIIAERWRGLAALIAGFLSGTIGGLSGTWGPPTVLYLVAVETPKARQIVVQGVIYGLGSVMLLLGHLRSGVLNGETVWFSAALLVPAFLGMGLGFQIQTGSTSRPSAR
jgi:Sulfite exporter TauE/SafE.